MSVVPEPDGVPGPRAPGARGPRVLLFTDTLGDVNGVSRFIRSLARAAREADRSLRVLTSTRLPVAPEPNITNVPPLWAGPMPGYPTLEVVAPPARAMVREARQWSPDAIHVSTPGPVGAVGLAAGRLLRVPVLATYHTDFPAYVAHLFGDAALTWLSTRWMRTFYRPRAGVFARSREYLALVARLGVPQERLHALRPGIDASGFNPAFRDAGVWDPFGAPPADVRVLYCGRVSVEKNLPMLARVWPEARRRLAAAGVRGQLVVAGDGPYRGAMERALAAKGAVFTGFRHGAELGAIYASSDLFVFPSLTDTLGQVVLEAQASGLPAIVSDRGGPREVVRDGETGLVCPGTGTGAPSAWQDAMVRLALDADLRRRMGAAARTHALAHSFEATFEHFWEVHERAITQRRA